ncbi:MAG: peptide-methionine (R)-S-oxide reductase MsrB [Myxococcota bacterium]
MAERKVTKTEAEWRAQLTADQYRILREKGTERAFTGALVDNKAAGRYRCVGCGDVLFDSSAKYDSGSGWPSYTRPADDGVIAYERDVTFGMVRTEVICKTCDGHLGHVFDDGPRAEGGKRYCINSACLTFEPEEAEAAAGE